MEFRKATKLSARLRLALIGPAGSGKTYTSLRIASALGSRVAVIDTERGSASKYADQFGFDVLELESFHPQRYVEAIAAAAGAGYDVLIIDSLSHAWSSKDGALELVDKAAARTKASNSFGAWREVTPLHNEMVDAIITAPMHVIATMRAKTEYVQEKDERTGRTTVRKIGLAPVQRDGLEYEFDVVADLDHENRFIVTKTRCPQLTGALFQRAGEDVAQVLRGWLEGATPATTAPVSKPVPEPLPDLATLDGEQLKALGRGLRDARDERWREVFRVYEERKAAAREATAEVSPATGAPGAAPASSNGATGHSTASNGNGKTLVEAVHEVHATATAAAEPVAEDDPFEQPQATYYLDSLLKAALEAGFEHGGDLAYPPLLELLNANAKTIRIKCPIAALDELTETQAIRAAAALVNGELQPVHVQD